MLGEVTEVFLKDGDPIDIYKIKVSLRRDLGKSADIFAYPLNPYMKSIPAVGEHVHLIFAATSEINSMNTVSRYYYISPTFLHSALNNNILPNAIKTDIVPVSNTNNYELPNVIKPLISSTFSANGGTGFVKADEISQIQPFIGDVIFEGRFGQSIRFGYTPQKTEAKNKPSWISTNPKSPITIIKNGVSQNNGYDKFIVENINEDKSSIWLTDKQQIKIKLSNKTSIIDVRKFPDIYSNPQVIINSDRLVFNSKSDSIILSGKNNIYLSTSQYKADVNELVSIVESLFNTVKLINQTLTGLTTAYSALTAPPLTPIGAPALAATTQLTSTILPQIVGLQTRLTKIKNV